MPSSLKPRNPKPLGQLVASSNNAGHGQPSFWQKAWDQFLAEPSKGSETLKIPEPGVHTVEEVEALLLDAEAMKDAHEGKKLEVRCGSHVWDLRNGLSEIIHWVQRFKEIGDIVVSIDPLHAAPPWAVFRFVLQMFIGAHEKMEATMAILKLVSRLFHHGRACERAYSSAMAMVEDPKALENLHEALVQLYVQILKSLDYCRSEFQKKSLRRLKDVLFDPRATEEVLQALNDDWDIVEDHAKGIDRLQLFQVSSELQHHLPDIMKNVNEILVKIDESKHQDILQRISKVPFRGHHKFIYNQRTPNTGDWLLQTPRFAQWQAAESSTITILYGSPGTGKTFLTSRVIQHIEEQLAYSKPCRGFAYFYCDRHDEVRRQPRSILCSLIQQFASPAQGQYKIHKRVQALDKKLQLDCLHMDIEMCKEVLIDLILSYQSSTIILDALDECDSGTRDQLMHCFTWLMEKSLNLKVFISSRKDHDIQKHFRHQPMIMIQARDNEDDIESFIRQNLAKCEVWTARESEVQEEIIAMLLSGSKGMFQWASLQVQLIRKMKSWDDTAMRKDLESLPTTLEEAYDQILSEINNQSTHDRKLAERAIQWVLCAAHPLSTAELATAMMIGSGAELLDIKEKPTEEIISGVCYNLLVLDKEQQRWRFCHLSAAEYLKSSARFQLEPDFYAATRCLQYFTLDQNVDGAWEFMWYASRHWHRHIKAQYQQKSEVGCPKLKHLVGEFLGSAERSSMAYQRWTQAMEHSPEYEYLMPSSSPLFALASFGLDKVLSNWYEGDGNLDLNACNEQGHSLLGIAAQKGHFEMCAFLVEKRVDIDKGSPSPLHLACSSGASLEILLLLLDNGASCDLRFGDESVLDAALKFQRRRGRERPGVMQLLAGRGAKIGDVQTALVNSAGSGYSEGIRHCLTLGADINGCDKDGNTALITAIQKEEIEAVKTLVERGADVNMISNGRSILGEAARLAGDSNEIVEVLLQARADPNPYGVRISPLCQAIDNGQKSLHARTTLVKMLLNAGAQVNLPRGIPPLVAAIVKSTDDLEMVKFLLGQGADPNLVVDFGCPLVTAIFYEIDHITQVLQQAGANPNKRNGFKNSLCLAAKDHSDLLPLLKMGADPTLTFSEGFGSALASAALSGNIEACRTLLKPELGVDVNAPLHGWFDSVLIAAIAHSSDWTCDMDAAKTDDEICEIVGILLEAGANILMPIYMVLEPTVPALRLQEQGEYFIDAVRAVAGDGNLIPSGAFPKYWICILWELASLPMPRPPLRLLLQSCKLPSSIPPSASVAIKLTSASNPYAVKYAHLFVSPYGYGRFIYINEEKESELSHPLPPVASIFPSQNTDLSVVQDIKRFLSGSIPDLTPRIPVLLRQFVIMSALGTGLCSFWVYVLLFVN